MSRPALLDLFCGAGGAAVGYARAGFEVIGVDVVEQPRYPFEFHLADALEFPLDGFEVIHASPPCQAYSDLRHRHREREYADLIWPIRRRLRDAGALYVIENVEGAPLLNPTTLCGTMFRGLRVLRHRLFETSFPLIVPPHPARHPLVFTHDRRKAHHGKLDQDMAFVQVTGGGNCTLANASAAMGIEWMTKAEINEAVPPAYTEYVGSFVRAALTLRAAA